MNHWFNLINILGSAILVAFGLFVWRVEPGNPRNRAFCLFALAFSLGTALSNLETLLDPSGATLEAEIVLRGLLYGLGGVAAAWFAYLVAEADRRMVAWAAAPGALLVGVLAAAYAGGSPFGRAIPWVAEASLDFGFWTLLGGSVFGAILLGLDFARPEHGPGTRRERAYLSAALTLYPGFYLTHIGMNTAQTIFSGAGRPLALGFVAASLLVAPIAVVGVWVRNTRVREASSVARNVALLAAGMGLVGLALSVSTMSGPGNLGVPFLARTGAVGILGYAILRGQMMGIDEKAEWGVSKTTVAGVFVAVFFVVSEGAQVLLAGFAGSEILGVLAAGGLVFFLAPIQRAADELADAVVPGGDASALPVDEAEIKYRGVVEGVLADGEITREEEDRLAEMAEELGVPPTRALEIRRDIEDELDGGGRAA